MKISGQKPSEKVLDYEFLRASGLKHIEELSSRIWTDYNVHDPGITTLELLCYVITDLGFRTSYPVQDLLAEPSEGGEPMFFSAARILPCRPVTVNDYRKLLIDIPGVKNGWLTEARQALFVDCRESHLTWQKDAGFEIGLKGLHEVTLEFEEMLTTEEKQKIVAGVKESLYKHRGLCEDFVDIQTIEQKKFTLCAEVELAPEADVDKTEAAVFHSLQRFLAPAVRFYSLKELLEEKKKKAPEIFEGPLLEHGFVDEEELEHSSVREEIRLSDIIQEIMKIEGVRAVRDILISPTGHPGPLKDKWIIRVTESDEPMKQPVLDAENSRVVYYKDVVPFRANKSNVSKILDQLRQKDEEERASGKTDDLPIPAGEDRHISDYYSFQNHFPRNYGIGPTGLPDSSSPTRKAQARQLKAYLLFFDQLMANYLAQLAHVKELFSMDEGIGRTYFTKLVNEDPGFKELYEEPEQLQSELQSLAEDKETFLTRRHRFVDHLLARFAESFSEYAWIMYSQYGPEAREKVLQAKLEYLQHYDTLSACRGLGFNTMDRKNLWDTTQVTGLEQRVSRLLGVENFSRRNLSDVWLDIYEERDKDEKKEYRFRVIDPRDGKILLSGSWKFLESQEAVKEMRKALHCSTDIQRFEKKVTRDGRFYFNVVDETGDVVARRIEYFETEEKREEAIRFIIDFLRERYSEEGFFVVEHILLRPLSEDANEKFLPVCVSPDCSNAEHIDPYSHRITVVLPAWPLRFSNQDFRRFVERTFRSETPAHVLPRICWVDQDQMGEFERAYQKWLLTRFGSSRGSTSKALNELIDVLSRLRSVYPKAALTSCDTGEPGRELFILNRTILGTQNG
jgi:hypothetical protein